MKSGELVTLFVWKEESAIRRCSRYLFAVRRFVARFLLVFHLISVPTLAASADRISIRIDGVADHVDLSRAAYLLEDPGGTLTFEQVRQPENAGRFKLASVHISLAVSAYWLRFSLVNGSSKPLALWFASGNRTLQEIALFTPSENGTYQGQSASSNDVFSKRPLPMSDFVFPIWLTANARTDIYLRVRSTGIVPVALGPSIWQPDAYREKENLEDRIWSYQIGVWVALGIFNLFWYFYSKDRNNILYIVWLFGAFLSLSCSVGGYGSIFKCLFYDSPILNQAFWFSSVWILVLFNSYFVINFLELHKNKRNITIVIIFLVALDGLWVLIQGFINLIHLKYTTIILKYLYITGCCTWLPIYPLLLYCVFTTAIAGDRSARFVAASFAPICAVFPYCAYSTAIGSAVPWALVIPCLQFEVFVMALALADRFNQLRLQKARAQADLIEGLRESERLLEIKVEQRTEALQIEQTRARDLLHNILPDEIADELSATGAARAARHESVTILFTDFSGFTQAAASMPAERMVAELNEIFGAFDEITAACEIEKIKTIGDAYMAASGLPKPCSDHAQRAVRAALGMVAYLDHRNERAAFKWRIRIGLHSGPVVAGVVGKHKYTYDVWGDTVNVASRMESSGEPGRINVSAYTFDLIREDFACEYRGKVTAKGKGEMDMYFVATSGDRLVASAYTGAGKNWH